MDKLNIHSKLKGIQSSLKAPKGQTNKFGGYAYRSAEDILTAVKPLLAEWTSFGLMFNPPVLEFILWKIHLAP